ncbi:hypothetical protein SAMN06297144_0174 [Sphingomonas guangdongensis]|uniref:DUF4352 domain-containing protein n=1 Tax=Sphingomonas guangdongensis TaxID=1141890 RepID=A0A285QF04_9SPHN|nr:hypothetical protein [Sphingomonas guangdongensis]SOB78707.1 hypothetical protein SAMN06297144_0174 [Sphingomonas guangdongensis]
MVTTLLSCGLIGCGGGTSDAGNQSAEQLPPSVVATSGTGALWANGAKKALDLQSAHPNGVVLQLTSVQSRPTETVLGVRVINGRDRAIELNRFNSNRDGYLALDTGERLYLSPPGNNPRLSVEAGQTLEGELVFLGKLPQSQSAVLILNENGQTDSQYTTTPGYRINLPLGTVAGAAAR